MADQGIEKLRKQVDTLIIIPNQYLIKAAENNTPIKQAFLMADDVLRQGVQGISELITEPGEINIDFADVRAIMKASGSAIMGIGTANGEGRALEAAKKAINSPILENSINGAAGVIINVTGGSDLTLHEVYEAAEVVNEAILDDANVIFGAVIDEKIQGDISITVIATGFELNQKVSEKIDTKNFFDKVDTLKKPDVTLPGTKSDVSIPGFLRQE